MVLGDTAHSMFPVTARDDPYPVSITGSVPCSYISLIILYRNSDLIKNQTILALKIIIRKFTWT